MIPIDRIHGGHHADGALDFSTSINPLGPPLAAREAYRSALADISGYPPAYSLDLEAALAKWLGVEPEMVLAGNGTTQLIYLLARVLKSRAPVVVTPTFSEIANSLNVAGIEPRALNTRSDEGFRFHPEAAIQCLREGADAVFIGRPNSPTGTMVTLDEAAAIAGECRRRDAWCVFDEAFIDFARDPGSAVAFAKTNRKALVLRSLTKIFALPGLRAGCVIGHPDALGKLRAAIEPWSVNAVAERVTRACLDVADLFIKETREVVFIEMDRVADALSRLDGIRVFPSVANFMMMDLANEAIPGAFGKHLLEGGIAVRDLHSLPGCRAGLYRLGIRSKSDNDRFLEVASSWAP